MKMLMTWLAPTIQKRLDQVHILADSEEKVRNAIARYDDIFKRLGVILGVEHSKLHDDLEDSVNWMRSMEGDAIFRYGLLDGMALGSELPDFLKHKELQVGALEPESKLKILANHVNDAKSVCEAEDRYEAALKQVEKLLPDEKNLLQSLHDAVYDMRRAAVEVTHRAAKQEGLPAGFVLERKVV
ncbi:hypothetical protein [Brevibacillus invocatus]|uniref:hypothetical protein n=1 Tax=Brevibacillus invocatus TaxID=173959 RepID=UPI00203FA538|nr:hypothetical protein [Brevibacillus invocatus]MCM3079609.1 hypothetical protein [Brevibacillus invocatus]MCM3429807.1 hypothetical protein [Brevibacillus invocatus]